MGQTLLVAFPDQKPMCFLPSCMSSCGCVQIIQEYNSNFNLMAPMAGFQTNINRTLLMHSSLRMKEAQSRVGTIAPCTHCGTHVHTVSHTCTHCSTHLYTLHHTHVHIAEQTYTHCITHLYTLQRKPIHTALHTYTHCSTHLYTLLHTPVHIASHTCTHCITHLYTLQYTHVHIASHTHTLLSTHIVTLSSLVVTLSILWVPIGAYIFTLHTRCHTWHGTGHAHCHT